MKEAGFVSTKICLSGVKKPVVLFLSLLIVFASHLDSEVVAFCGFYVAKVDKSLFNKASKVVLVRDGNQTTITMANDYEGDPENFAMVIPVPAVPGREDIKLVESRLIDHLDAYTAPRLVEYFDPDPCKPRYEAVPSLMQRSFQSSQEDAGATPKSLGVKIEAQYVVGEYDILILSAKQSQGLLEWLNREGYRVSQKAANVLGDYITKGMKFFIVKVNLSRQKGFSVAKKSEKTGSYLTPLQLRMESKNFMLPIRLGMINAQGDQELLVFALTRKGRVEGDNYPTLKIPSNKNVPPFIKGQFGRFYKDMFAREQKLTPRPAMFLEYAWDMSWCDPCAANPPSTEDLVELGASWLKPAPVKKNRTNAELGQKPDEAELEVMQPETRFFVPPPGNMPLNAYITRLHMRYNEKTFPKDLLFRVTDNRKNFQGRYVIQQPFKGEITCEAGERYKRELKARGEAEAISLSRMTGWSLDYIEAQQKAEQVEAKQGEME